MSLDALLTYPVETASPIDTERSGAVSSGDALDSFLGRKADGLGAMLRDIERDAVSRRALSARISEEVGRQYRYLKTKLYELDLFPCGASRAVERRRSSLEQQLDTLNEERRKEGVTAWQDMAKLRVEWRTWFKQYADVQQRLRLILAARKSG